MGRRAHTHAHAATAECDGGVIERYSQSHAMPVSAARTQRRSVGTDEVAPDAIPPSVSGSSPSALSRNANCLVILFPNRSRLSPVVIVDTLVSQMGELTESLTQITAQRLTTATTRNARISAKKGSTQQFGLVIRNISNIIFYRAHFTGVTSSRKETETHTHKTTYNRVRRS